MRFRLIENLIEEHFSAYLIIVWIIIFTDDVECFEAAQKMSELDLQTCEWDFS